MNTLEKCGLCAYENFSHFLCYLKPNEKKLMARFVFEFNAYAVVS